MGAHTKPKVRGGCRRNKCSGSASRSSAWGRPSGPGSARDHSSGAFTLNLAGGTSSRPNPCLAKIDQIFERPAGAECCNAPGCAQSCALGPGLSARSYSGKLGPDCRAHPHTSARISEQLPAPADAGQRPKKLVPTKRADAMQSLLKDTV